MKKEALFCDGTEAYVSPPEPEAGEEGFSVSSGVFLLY